MLEGIFFLGGGGGEGYACGFLFNFSKVTENAILDLGFHLSCDQNNNRTVPVKSKL